MKPGTVRVITSILEFMGRGGPETTFTASIFTTTGHKGAIPMAIRKLKASGAIEVAGKDSDGRALYRRGPGYDAGMSSFDFE